MRCNSKLIRAILILIGIINCVLLGYLYKSRRVGIYEWGNAKMANINKESTNETTSPTSTATTTTFIENQKNKHLHFLSRDEPYQSRMLGIQERCLTIKDPLKLPIRTKTMKYNDNITTVMCEVPKVASTSWQKLILKLGGYTKEVTKQEIDQGAIPNKHFDQLKTKEQASAKMKNYLTFMVTRHPFERLVSAHHDKFSDKDPNDYYRKHIGRQIAKAQSATYLNGITFTPKMLEDSSIFNNSPLFNNLTKEKQEEVLNYLNVMKTGEISFYQFVKYILNFDTPIKAKGMDIHWRPQTYLCMPCAYSYSYVIRFENLSEESNRLLDYLQTYHNASKSDITRFPSRTPSVKHEATTNAFAEIPEKSVEALRKIYHDDFYILGYDPYLYRGYE